MECSKPSLAPLLIACGFLISAGRPSVSITNSADRHFKRRGRNVMCKCQSWTTFCVHALFWNRTSTRTVKESAVMPCCLWKNDLQAELHCMAEIFPAAGKTMCQPGRIPQLGRNMALLLVYEPAYQVELPWMPKISPCLFAKWPANQNNIAPPLAKPLANRSFLLTEEADWFSTGRVRFLPWRVILPVQ